MTKGEVTRKTIIERAAPLFNQRCFHGCSMSDIMDATGLEKGGLYRPFSSKEAIAEAAFRYSVEASLKSRLATVAEDASPLEALRGQIAQFVRTASAVQGGCPLMNTAIDADDGNETLRILVREAFRGWRANVITMVDKAIAAHELASDTETEWLANAIMTTLEGAVMLSRLERRKAPLLHAQRALNVVLDSIALKRSSPSLHSPR
jgi:TetR/AcrR family transcriptional repressor of nem operon